MVGKSGLGTLWPTPFEPFRPAATRLCGWPAPASEASSDDGACRIGPDLPGADAKAMPLSVENGMVTAKGRKKSGRGETGATRHLSVRRFGSFGRSFRLPADADADADEAGAKADPKDGVPTVRVPRKAPAAPEARRGPIGKG